VSGVRFPLCPFFVLNHPAADQPPDQRPASNYAWCPRRGTQKKRPPPGFSMSKNASNPHQSDEFWRDDAVAIPKREGVNSIVFRMPTVASIELSKRAEPNPFATSSVTESPKPRHSTGATIFAVCLVISVSALVFEAFYSASKRRAAAELAEASLFNSAPMVEQERREQAIEDAVRGGVIQRLESQPTRAELRVGPVFRDLHDHEKNAVVRYCYFYAFGLPESATSFSRPMAVIDSTGKRIATVDLAQMGLRL
jgi:hypothetical protein